MTTKEIQKRVLLVTSIFPPQIGGPALYVQRLKRELTARGHRVHVVTFAPGQADEVIRGGSFLRMIRLFVHFVKKKDQFDTVITFNTWSTGLPCALASKLLKEITFIIRIGGDYLWERNSKGETLEEYYASKQTLKERIIHFWIRVIIRSFDCVISTTQWYKNFLQKEYGVQETVSIENPFPEMQVKRKQNGKRFLFAGRLVELKNVSLILNAMYKLPGAMLDVVGDGPMLSKLQQEVKDLEIEERVTFLGKLKQEDLLATMAQSRAVIISSFSEISPNTMLEAFASGTPVICTRSCGYKDKYSDVATFFDPHSEESLRDAMAVHQDANKYADIIDAVSTMKKLPSWKQVGEQYAQII